jgi:sensor histidine kinase regulating citrate/malate metabolism
MDDIGNGPAGTLSRHENSFAIILLLFMLLVGAMIALFLVSYAQRAYFNLTVKRVDFFKIL